MDENAYSGLTSGQKFHKLKGESTKKLKFDEPSPHIVFISLQNVGSSIRVPGSSIMVYSSRDGKMDHHKC